MLKSIKKASCTSILLILVLGPYLINTSIDIPFSLSFLWLGLFLIFLEIGYQKFAGLLLEKYKVDINVFFIPTIVILFYYETFILLIDNINNISVKLPIIRARYYLPLIWILLIIFYFYIRSKLNRIIVIIHSFLVILILTLYISSLIQNHSSDKPLVSHFIPMNTSYSKPVILLVLDEYSSPNELYKLYKSSPDPSLFEFSKSLTSSGWKVNNNQFSNDLLTFNSLSSLFNYNLKLPYDRINANKAILELRESYLLNDLKKKGVKIYNFGIFDIGDSNAFLKLFFYEKEEQNSHFLRQLFGQSLIRFLYDPLPGNKQLYLNRFLIENGYKMIKPLAEEKVFIYLHLLMPHSPFVYEGKSKFIYSSKLNKIENYVSYWHFTNHLVKAKLLDSLVKTNSFKIILTGDHGYRGESDKVNPHKTMTAYYGFDKSQVTKIQSVQDLGSLIYASY